MSLGTLAKQRPLSPAIDSCHTWPAATQEGDVALNRTKFNAKTVENVQR